MSVFISCPYDCSRKDIARNVFVDLTKDGLKTFYNGDILDDMRAWLSNSMDILSLHGPTL